MFGGGTVLGNGHILAFAASTTSIGPSLTGTSFIFDNTELVINADMVFSDTFVFKGACTIDGQGHILDINEGNLHVDNDATLYLRNVIIKNIWGQNISCTNNTGKIILQDVVWMQNNDYIFSAGSFEFKDAVWLSGDAVFAYQSSQTSIIDVYTKLVLDNGLTFSYDPDSGAKDLLDFTNNTSELLLDTSTLHVIGSLVPQGRWNDTNIS